MDDEQVMKNCDLQARKLKSVTGPGRVSQPAVAEVARGGGARAETDLLVSGPELAMATTPRELNCNTT